MKMAEIISRESAIFLPILSDQCKRPLTDALIPVVKHFQCAARAPNYVRDGDEAAKRLAGTRAAGDSNSAGSNRENAVINCEPCFRALRSEPGARR